MTVTYEPTTAGSHTATLKLSTNGNVTKELALTGTATLATPTATDATNIISNSFTANWNTVQGAESYELDVWKETGGGVAPELVQNGGFEIGDRSNWTDAFIILPHIPAYHTMQSRYAICFSGKTQCSQ